jgi:DNA polymerase III subunit epsilon
VRHGDSGSFDDPATPLHDVTFCVIDLETTGGSPASCAITEIGAARFRGGERQGTFQTLVNPGVPVSPEVTVLTGITEAMLQPAPPVEAVLPSLLEFVSGSVLVGHNLRFDVSFLDAALAASGRPPLGHRQVDTVALARRLVRDDADEVWNCRLGTLADRFRLDHRSSHRALDDVLATADLLHLLLERAAAFGAYGLDDLLALPRLAGHPRAPKLRLTARLPRAPGVYVFRDRHGRALRVGKAADLRNRVRSYFAGRDERTAALLRETQAVDHLVCASPIEAAVLELRLIQEFEPRFNRTSGRARAYRYVMASAGRRSRLVVTRSACADGAPRLGPFPSTAVARRVVEALGSAEVAPDLVAEPDQLVEALADRVLALDRVGRHDEAASIRDAAAALGRARRRHQRLDELRRSGHTMVELPDGRRVELARGRLLRAGRAGTPPTAAADAGSAELARFLSAEGIEAPPAAGPVPLDLVDELTCVAAWLDRYGDRLRIVCATRPARPPDAPEAPATPGTPGTPDTPGPPAGSVAGPVAGSHEPAVYADRPCSPRS